VKRSLYARAVGYNYEAVKIFMPAGVLELPAVAAQPTSFSRRFPSGPC
jgi:hypothetical protein